MLKIAVIGRSETVVGFKALGLDTFAVSDDEESLKALRHLTRECGDYAIIYIEETFADALDAEIKKYKESPTPAIILIPGRDGSTGRGLNALNEAVEKAVGTNILD